MNRSKTKWLSLLAAVAFMGGVVFPVTADEVKQDKKQPAKQVQATEKAAPADAQNKEPAKEKKAPENAALVNGKAIDYKDFSLELDIYKKRLAQQGTVVPPEMMGNLETQVLTEMINNELLLQESQKEGIKVKPEEVTSTLDEIKARYSDPKQFETILANMSMTEDQLKHKLAQNLAVRHLLDNKIVSSIKISDEEAKTFYDGNPSYFQKPEEVRARHILIGSKEDDTAEAKAKARKKIEEIQKRVAAGEDFEKLAKENSECPSAANGGDLGYFSKGKMVRPFAEAAFALKPNEVSDIVQTSFGFHLIKAIDHREAQTVAFEEAKPRILQNLRNEQIQAKVTDYVAELRKGAKIETFLQ